jgi:hypothetical protein
MCSVARGLQKRTFNVCSSRSLAPLFSSQRRSHQASRSENQRVISKVISLSEQRFQYWHVNRAPRPSRRF